jgi:hypothetical protein
MPTASKPLVPPGPLTFAELRLANLTRKTDHGLPPWAQDMDLLYVAMMLADHTIQNDRIAADVGIDLEAAIRLRFDYMAGRVQSSEDLALVLAAGDTIAPDKAQEARDIAPLLATELGLDVIEEALKRAYPHDLERK